MMAALSLSHRAIVSAVCALFLSSPAQAESPVQYEQFALPNGLQVIVIPSHKVPAVSHMLWFRVGAADDPPGESGLVHFHEHMMFRGSEHTKPGDYSRMVTRMGGNQNAFTSRDYTGYYINVAKEHLVDAMQLEAERMQFLNPPQDEFGREREVIIEERRMRIENKPSAMLDEQMDAALFLNHPYHIPVIGWKHEMAQLSGDAVMKLHREHYCPANATLVVAGDVTTAEVKQLAEQHYGVIPTCKPYERHWRGEPEALAERRVTVRDDAVTQPSWRRYYMADSMVYGKTERAMPLYLLGQLLGGGDASILYRTLVVEKRLATQVAVDYNALSIGPGIVEIMAVPAPGVSLDKLEKAIDQAIADFKTKEVDAQDLARAQNLMAADVIYARDGLQSMAYIFGQLRVLGLDVALFDQWPTMIRAVTAPQILEAAKVTLVPQRSVTGLLLPEK